MSNVGASCPDCIASSSAPCPSSWSPAASASVARRGRAPSPARAASGRDGRSAATGQPVARRWRPSSTEPVRPTSSCGWPPVAASSPPACCSPRSPNSRSTATGPSSIRDPATSYIEPSPSDGVARRQAFQTAKLSEAQVQAILADAIGPGGLGTAEELYTPCCIADAPSTTFTLRTTDLDKTVTVGALGFDSPNQGADAAARTAFQALAKRLVAPDLGTVTPATYVPAAYRGILYDAVDISPSAPSTAWPWTTFGPDGFTVVIRPGGDAGPDPDAVGRTTSRPCPSTASRAAPTRWRSRRRTARSTCSLCGRCCPTSGPDEPGWRPPSSGEIAQPATSA